MIPARRAPTVARERDHDLCELGALVQRALDIADKLGLSSIGISLDTARVGLMRRARGPADHPTLQ